MSKKRHIGLWIAGGLVVLLVLLIVGAQVAVNSRWAKHKVNQILSSVIDGEIDYANLDMSLVRSFPVFRVTLDTVSLTYDHDRFASWDSLGDRHALLSRGRGVERDTLADFDRLTAAVNLWKLIGGRIRVKEVRLEGLDAFLHFYDSSASNLDIFLPSDKKKEKDTSKVFSTPVISIGKVCIPDLSAVYTDQSKSMYAQASLDSLELKGHFRFNEDGEFKFRGVDIAIDSLNAFARIPSDSASVSLPRLYLSEPYKNVFDLGLDMLASAETRKWGTLVLPADFAGRIGVNFTDEYRKFVVPALDGRIAHIPLHIDGNARIYADSTIVDANADLKDCPLDTLINEYGVKFVDLLKQVRTDAHVDISASAKGKFFGKKIPQIEASVKIPRSRVAYMPLGLDGTLLLDADASLSPTKVLNASVNELKAILPGISLEADATGRDILSGDPDVNLVADASVDASSVMALLPDNLGIWADGDARLSVLARGKPSDFVALDFAKVSLNASLDADRLAMRMPKDTLSASLYSPDLHVVFGGSGGDITITTDSLSFRKGVGLEVRARSMKTDGAISNVETRGGLMPHLNLAHSDAGISLRTGNNWFRIRDIDIKSSATKRGRLSDELKARMKERMVRDSIERSTKSYLKDKDFEKKDIKISLDTTILRYIRQWNPVAQVSVGRGMAAMPVLPLRTRIGGMKASFDGDVLEIDTLSTRVGTSDLALKGRASGLRRFLRGGGEVTAELDAFSKRVNVNEIMAAFSAGKELADSSFSENDESFVVDSLEDAQFEEPSGLPLIVLPGNVSATMNYVADTVDYSDFRIHPVLTTVNLKERTVQLSDTRVFTDLGKVLLSGFYSARNKEEISAGVDVGIYGVSPDSLIRLLPSMDSMMPALKSLNGRLNCEVTAMTQLDTAMRPVMPSLEGVVRLNGKNLTVEDAGSLRKITKLLQFRNPNIGKIDDLNLSAVVHDNKVDIFPFILGVDRYRLALHGMQGLDKTMYYHASVLKSPFIMKFGVNVFGTFDKWGFTIGLPKYNARNLPDFSSQIDTMQNVIRRTIRDVFLVDEGDILDSGASDLLREKEQEIGYESGLDLAATGGAEDSEQAAFEYDAMLEEEQLQAEVDQILEDSYRDIADMMSEYESQIYDKNILRKMAKLEKKQARKNKKQK